MAVKIDKDALDVLVRSRVENNVLFLPPAQLERNLYVKVNKALEAIGGSWNRKAKGHTFSSDVNVEELLDDLINNGEYIDKKKEFQFFETPVELAKELVEWAEIESDMTVIEPSFGKGRILNLFPDGVEIYGIELNKENFEYTMKATPVHYKHLVEADFLKPEEYQSYIPEKIDRIVMNPPFSNGQDVLHIIQAWELLDSGGILVSVVSESPFFRENKLSKEFRAWLNETNAEVRDLEAGAFRESGTNVKTRIIKVRKP